MARASRSAAVLLATSCGGLASLEGVSETPVPRTAAPPPLASVPTAGAPKSSSVTAPPPVEPPAIPTCNEQPPQKLFYRDWCSTSRALQPPCTPPRWTASSTRRVVVRSSFVTSSQASSLCE